MPDNDFSKVGTVWPSWANWGGGRGRVRVAVVCIGAAGFAE